MTSARPPASCPAHLELVVLDTDNATPPFTSALQKKTKGVRALLPTARGLRAWSCQRVRDSRHRVQGQTFTKSCPERTPAARTVKSVDPPDFILRDGLLPSQSGVDVHEGVGVQGVHES